MRRYLWEYRYRMDDQYDGNRYINLRRLMCCPGASPFPQIKGTKLPERREPRSGSFLKEIAIITNEAHEDVGGGPFLSFSLLLASILSQSRAVAPSKREPF
jgi:hypothetical protein